MPLCNLVAGFGFLALLLLLLLLLLLCIMLGADVYNHPDLCYPWEKIIPPGKSANVLASQKIIQAEFCIF